MAALETAEPTSAEASEENGEEVEEHEEVSSQEEDITDDATKKNTEENDEDDEEDEVPIQRKKRIIEDDDEEEDEEDDEDEAPKRTKKVIIEEDDEEDDEGNEEKPEDSREVTNHDTGTSEDDKESDSSHSERGSAANSEDDDEEVDERRQSSQQANNTIYDFDIMMAKKKEENSRKRRRRNYDIINDNDDIIADIINQMKEAYETDIEANKNKTAATKKLKLLPFVISQLRKVDLKDAFLDSDVLSVITEWLAPLPDKSLPHLNIRESFLKLLIEFNLYDVDRIKASGIGKAIMYLYKHPKETKENKQRAKQLISSWSRPIFNLDSSFTSISREEREQRDLELMNKKRKSTRLDDDSEEEGAGTSSGTNKQKSPATEPVAKKPGDKGWIPRARVPAPSTRDYVIRPQSKVDGDVGKSNRRPSNMLDKYRLNQSRRRK